MLVVVSQHMKLTIQATPDIVLAMGGKELGDVPRPSLSDVLGLPGEFRRFNDILKEIGPENISTLLGHLNNVLNEIKPKSLSAFFDDFHQIAAIAASNPDALKELIERWGDSNIIIGTGLLKWRISYDKDKGNKPGRK